MNSTVKMDLAESAYQELVDLNLDVEFFQVNQTPIEKAIDELYEYLMTVEEMQAASLSGVQNVYKLKGACHKWLLAQGWVEEPKK